MHRTHLICLVCAVLMNYSCKNLLAQTTDATAKSHKDESQTKSIVKIIAEPKTSRPFDWKQGEKITVGVRCVSVVNKRPAGVLPDAELADNIGVVLPPVDELVGNTRVVGLATDVELVAIRPFENRVEMMLRADAQSINKIEAAAKISEYWFEIMPFKEEHRKTLADDVDLQEFLKLNTHHPANDSNWGYGAPGGRLTPPSEDQLPTRK